MGYYQKFHLTLKTQGIYIYNTFILLIAVNSLLCGTFFFASHLFKIISSISNGFNLKYILLFLFLNTPTLINEYILLIHERSKSLIHYGIFTFFGFIISVAFPFYYGFGFTGVLSGLTLFAVIKLIYTFFLMKIYGKLKLDIPFIKSHFSYTLPLILSFLLSSSSDYIDGFLVTSHFGAVAFAIFRYGAREFPVSLLLASGLSTALVPIISVKSDSEEVFQKLKKTSLRLMHFLFPITILLILTSSFLYPVIFRSEFISSAPIFNIYLLLIVSRMVFPQTVVLAKQSTGIVFRIAFIEMLINLIASYCLMLKFGIIGVAWGTVIAYYSEKILLAFYLYQTHKISPGRYIPLKPWIFYTILTFFIYIFVENFVS